MKCGIRTLLLSSFVCLVIFSSCKRHVIKENLYNMYQKVGSPLYNQKIWDLFKRELKRIDNNVD